MVLDVETDEPLFGTVKEGFIGRHLTFIPLGGTQVGPDDLRVSVTKEQVRAAPDNEVHGEELSQDDESARYHHFDDELHSAGHEAKARPVGAAQSFLASTCRAGDQ